MAVRFNQFWADEIAEETEREEYQTCEVKLIDSSLIRYPGPNYPADPNDLTTNGYDRATDTYKDPVVTGEVYVGRARFIPIRAGIFHGGESQANAMSVRAMRLQLPQSATPFQVKKGIQVRIISAPRNLSLEGTWGAITDDFQGSSAATRTLNVSMDSDASREG